MPVHFKYGTGFALSPKEQYSVPFPDINSRAFRSTRGDEQCEPRYTICGKESIGRYCKTSTALLAVGQFLFPRGLGSCVPLWKDSYMSEASVSRRAVFLGSKQPGLDSLRILHETSPETLIAAVTVDDSSDGRSVFGAFKDFSDDAGIGFHVSRSRADTHDILNSLRPDLCFVQGWYQLFTAETLAIAPNGFIGVHPSLLPRFRGGSPLVWSLIAGEKKVGTTLFIMSEGMDDGPIVHQISLDVLPEDDIASVMGRIDVEFKKDLPDIWRRLIDGTAVLLEQDQDLATFCAQRFPEDGLIDWHLPAVQVYDFVRAQAPPYPGAYFIHDGRKIIITKCQLFDRPYYGTAGQVARMTPDGVQVICGDHRALLIKEILVDGELCKAETVLKSMRTRLRSASV